MANIWFTADTHFGSERTRVLSQRPFPTVDDMDMALINNWNSMVQPDDIVFHLGDFGNYDVLDNLNGRVILIKGNYDKNIPHTHRFYKVMRYFIVPNLVADNVPTLLIHKPIDAYKIKEPFNFVLFGHIHDTQKVKRNGINVGVDCNHFSPVSLDSIRFLYVALKKYYDRNVFDQLEQLPFFNQVEDGA